jgi:hypothetical protein
MHKNRTHLLVGAVFMTVISSRFRHQVYCPEKIKALLNLRAINGVVLEWDRLVGSGR